MADTCCNRDFTNQVAYDAHRYVAHRVTADARSITSAVTPPDAAVMAVLQQSMIDLYDLSIIGKATHWSMQGGTMSSAFLPMHRELDDVIDFARDKYDTVAERIIQLGRFPDARVATIAADTPLAQIPPGPLTIEDAIIRIAAALELLSVRFVPRMNSTTSDWVTQNMLIDIATTLAKFSWFWQASLPMTGLATMSGNVR